MKKTKKDSRFEMHAYKDFLVGLSLGGTGDLFYPLESMRDIGHFLTNGFIYGAGYGMFRHHYNAEEYTHRVLESGSAAFAGAVVGQMSMFLLRRYIL